MIYTVDLLFKARQEIFEAWKWYEEQQTGLGDRFEEEVFRKIALIEANPSPRARIRVKAQCIGVLVRRWSQSPNCMVSSPSRENPRKGLKHWASRAPLTGSEALPPSTSPGKRGTMVGGVITGDTVFRHSHSFWKNEQRVNHTKIVLLVINTMPNEA